ncbi:MAG: hypothetical protein HY683_03920 [Chloroflexi bacterium]|nr:hypothetical protein [Chloroflexota bacterium]
MYGTIARIQPKRGREQDVIRHLERWNKERRPRAKGARESYAYKLEKGGMMLVAVFDSKESYFANASDPEQDRWYRQFRELLEADPEWNDGEVVGAVGLDLPGREVA